MIPCTLYEISININGKLIGKNIIIENISINSNIIGKNCLFIAFIGKNFDAHNFINEAIKNNAVAILVNKYIHNISISQIIVNNVNESLFHIARLIRNKSKACFIAITGSCGKTSVKEMLINILKYKYNINYTIHNNNNIIGVSLTLCSTNIYNKIVIVEVGSDNLLQIKKIINILNPNIILINNLFISHFEKLNSSFNLTISKGEILSNLYNYNRIILNFDNNNWRCWKHLCFNKNPIFFSINKFNKTDFYSYNIILKNFKSIFNIHTPIGKKKIFLNVPGVHNIYNSLAAISISISIGINLNSIYKGLCNFKYINHRFKPIYIDKNKIIIDDTYNANIGSFFSSLKTFLNIKIKYKILVISNIYELGNSEKFLHKMIGNILKKYSINKIFSIGELAYFVTLNNNTGEHFYNKNDLINRILYLINNKNEILFLIKGSRNNKLDLIINSIIKKLKND